MSYRPDGSPLTDRPLRPLEDRKKCFDNGTIAY